jgi:hypothetical protein
MDGEKIRMDLGDKRKKRIRKTVTAKDTKKHL